MFLEMKKCFCFIPLKVGLSFYGYISLIFWSILSIDSPPYEVRPVFDYRYFDNNRLYHIFMVACFVQPVASIILLFGVHLSNVKCLQVFYWYNTVAFIPIFLASSIVRLQQAVLQYYSRFREVPEKDKFYLRQYYYQFIDGFAKSSLSEEISILVIGMATAIYVLLAVRSYSIKLKRDTSKPDHPKYKAYIEPV